jgi:hypothetical protein
MLSSWGPLPCFAAEPSPSFPRPGPFFPMCPSISTPRLPCWSQAQSKRHTPSAPPRLPPRSLLADRRPDPSVGDPRTNDQSCFPPALQSARVASRNHLAKVHARESRGKLATTAYAAGARRRSLEISSGADPPTPVLLSDKQVPQVWVRYGLRGLIMWRRFDHSL